MVAGSALRVKASVTEMLFSVDLESGSGRGCSARNHCAVSLSTLYHQRACSCPSVTTS